MEIAVILPCRNEEKAIYKVVADFRKFLPEATIYVFDNNSTDKTIEEAQRAGCEVRSVKDAGKGNVVRKMFADIEADVYLMADGDGTYDANYARALVDELLVDSNDMVVGTRKSQEELAYRRGHKFGNRLLTGIVRFIFGSGFTDMLSGYRAFSRRFVKTFPSFSSGFEIETELTIHALWLGLPCSEIETPYYQRAEDSNSKLSTYKDGFKILMLILALFKDHKPFAFFGFISTGLAILSLILAAPVVVDFVSTGLIERVPTLLLCTGMMLTAVLLFVSGVILDSLNRGRRENFKLHYLKHQAFIANTNKPKR
jgi:glycosyltransferase involved in cell wall biosynthesis